MSKKATIIAVVNQKGGTGKTTTTENLGVGLALEGKKVLLVDTDPQASLTVSLGNPCPDDLSPTLSDLMGKIMMENPITPDEGILHHPEGVDLVPSNIELSGMEVALVNAMSRETILRQYLDTVKQNYDYILLDCMPFNEPVALVMHDEGKLAGKDLNRALRDDDGDIYDIVAGDFLVVGLGEDDFCSLSPELMKQFEEHFHQPETFVRMGRSIMALPLPDDMVKKEDAPVKADSVPHKSNPDRDVL